jgi:hypothetical protein
LLLIREALSMAGNIWRWNQLVAVLCMPIWKKTFVILGVNPTRSSKGIRSRALAACAG